MQQEATKKGVTATEWANEVAMIVGGKAGGKGNTSQGVGNDPNKVEEAVEHARNFIEKLGL